MEVLPIWIGAVAAFLTSIVILIGLALRARRWIKTVHRETLVEVGLIRPIDPLNPVKVSQWPNGYSNLPDAIEGMDNRIRKYEDAHRKT